MPQRSRCQRKLRRKGYTYEVTSLRKLWEGKTPKLILILDHGSWRWWRRHPTLPGDVVRPVGTYYINNGKKPRR